MRYVFGDRDTLEKKLENKNIFLCLDYDGTLAPIVREPEEARVPKRTKTLLLKLSQSPHFKLAVISGRALSDLKKRLKIKNIIYVGNHGLEAEGPKIKFRPLAGLRERGALRSIKKDLSERLSSVKGVVIEDKGFTLSVHYRKANRRSIPKVRKIFHEAVNLHSVKNQVKVRAGKMVLEIRPPVEWDKGKIALWLLSRQRFALKGKGILPIYIGDDVTDEDAFKALKNKGITIFVGRRKPSRARYCLKDTKEVFRFLNFISELKRKEVCLT